MKTIMNIKDITLRGLFSLMMIALMSLFGFTSCSDDDDDVISTKSSFPTLQEIYVNAGDNTTLSFTASARFILTSSQNWCTFDGEITYSGEAGDQQVPLTISRTGQSQDSVSVATITMIIGEESQAIATVTRSASDTEITIYDEDGNEISLLTAGYSNYIYYTITANFDFNAIELPDWLDLDGTIYSTKDTPTKVGLKVKDEASYFKYPQDAEVAISNESGTIIYPIQIVYDGMDADEIKITMSTSRTDVIRIPTWNWEISQDGKTYKNEGETYGSIAFSLDALNDDYVVVKMERHGDDYKIGVDSRYNSSRSYTDVDWIHLSDDGKGGITFTVDALDEGSRIGYILAFPRKTYETIQEDLLYAIVNVDDADETEQAEMGDIRYTYQQHNSLIGFTQEEESTDLFVVVSGLDQNTKFVLEDTYSGSTYTSLESELQAKYNTTDIQWLKYDANQWDKAYYEYPVNYLITPLPLDKDAEWGWFENSFVYDANGNNAEANDDYDLAIEPQNYQGLYPCLGFQMLEKDPHMAFYFPFIDDDGNVRIFVLYDK
ncbi:MAG: DUF5003 domain-containing protein [Prevotella sp.]|nr:DUF5003 domain-containing protein [Prevotella sp.]